MRLLLFLAFSTLLVNGHDGPHLINSSIWFTESSILDVEYDVAVAQLTFDDDLYFNEPFLCSGADKPCAPFTTQPCLPCDWSNHDPNSPIDCGHVFCCGPAQVGGEAYAHVNEWCDSSLVYTTLRVGQPSQRYFLNTGETMYFRFFISERYYCRPFNVAVRPDYGTANMFISQLWAQPDANHSSAARVTSQYSFGQTVITECPNVFSQSDYGIPHVGTYALAVEAVVPTSFYVELSVSSQTYPLPAPVNPVNCSTVPHWEYDYAGLQNPGSMVMCVPDTTTVNVSLNTSMVGEYVQLILPVNAGCYNVQIAINMLTFDTDVDLYCLPPDSRNPVTRDNSLVARWWTGDDHLVINACFDQVRYLHCSAQVWKPGNISIIWSTTSVANLLWIENVSAGVFSMQHTGAMGSIVLGKPSASCVDNYANCFNWLTPSLDDPLVFWPPPSSVNRPKATFNPTPLEMILNAKLAKKLNRTLTFVSALSVGGQVLFSNTSSFFRTATFAVLSITNAKGQVLDLPMNGVDNNNRGDVRFYVPNIAASSLRNVTEVEQCQYTRYTALQNLIDSEMDLSLRSTNLSDMLLHMYNIDTLSSSFTHVACLRQAKKGLTVVQNQTIVHYHTYECTYDPAVSYSLWAADPCCNVKLRAVSCCAPRNIATVTPVYSSPNSTYVDEHSGLPGCSTSFYSDVGKALNILDDPVKGCDSGIPDFTAAIAASVENEFEQTVRYCQTAVGLGPNFQGVACAVDSDCQSQFGTLCNLRTRKCLLPPLQTVESNYLSCFLTQMSSATEDYIRTKVLPTPMWDAARSDPAFVEAVRSAATVSDCVVPTDPLDITYRSKYVYDASSSSCKASAIAFAGVNANDCNPQPCLGTSCRVPPSQCFKLCYPSYTFYPSSQDTCPMLAPRCSVAGSAPCLGEGVCAYCGDGSDGGGPRCRVAPGNFNEVTCPMNTVCAFPNGTTAFGMSPYDCLYQTDPTGYCSVDCPGQSCRSYTKSPGVCWAPSVTTQQDCAQLAAQVASDSNINITTSWNLGSVCVADRVTDSASCLALNDPNHAAFQFDTCGGYSLGQCGGNAPVQYLMKCFVDNWSPCKNRIECQTYGSCSDRVWTTRPVDDAANKKFAVQFGACFSSGFTDDSQKEPYCYSTMDRPGIGCRELALNSSDQCIPFSVNDAGEWWWRTWLTPAMTQYDCQTRAVGRYGCLIPGIEQNLRWLNPADCECAGGKMQYAFKWTPGVWNSGVVRQLTWTTAVATPNYVWSNSTLSFEVIESWVRGSAQVRYLNSGKSEVLCNNNLINQPLGELVCDGLSSNSPALQAKCYKSSFHTISFPVAVGSACEGEAVTVKSPFANVAFAKNSIQNGCVSANLSAVSSEWFRQLRGSRGSTFVLKYFGQRGWVQNTKGTVVGVVAGDGLNVSLSNWNSINTLTVCLGVSAPKNTTRYPIRDFALLHSGLRFMTPLNLSIIVTNYDVSELWCAQVTHPKGSFIVVPIYEMKNSNTLNHSQQTANFMYALNAMYFLSFLLIVFALFLIGKPTDIASLILLSFFCLCIFRIVFTLMYPLGEITNSTDLHQLIGEYITFETPSFLYATAAFLTLKFAIPSITYQTLFIAVFAVWMLWVVSVSVFSEVVLDVPNSFEQCPGRGQEEDEAIRHKAMHLSVAWHAVLFFWSMVIIHYVRSNQADGASSVRSYFQALILYLFWVHELLFIIILADDMSSSVYVFVTLLITETFMMVGLTILVISSPFEFEDPKEEEKAPAEKAAIDEKEEKKEEASPPAEAKASLPPSSVPDSAPMMEEIPV